MIRVYIHDPDGMSEALRTSDLVEAEAHYLRLVQRRGSPPRAVVIHGDPVAEGRYRIDAERPAVREESGERYRQLWAPPREGWTGPTPEQLRGLVVAAGVSGSEIARRIGVTPRQWRTWTSDAPGLARIPYASWVAALRLTGMLPEGEHCPPE